MPITAQGVDYAFSHPSIASLKAGGYTFACRYLYPMSQNPGTKNLTRDEATTLNRELQHGVVSNYESWAGRPRDGHQAGIDDARAAQGQHTACGGKLDRPIYFSVDFDAQPPDYPALRGYFLGVASVIGLERTGAYSGYGPIKWLLDNGLIKWAWQTYAWSGGRYDERCQLSQDKLDVAYGGGTVDLDSAHAEDFGQWNYNAEEADMPLTDAEITKVAAAVWAQKITPNATATQHLIAANNQSDSASNYAKAAAGGTVDIKKAVADVAAAVGNVDLTPEQIAALGAIIAKVATPNYGGHVVLEPIAPPA